MKSTASPVGCLSQFSGGLWLSPHKAILVIASFQSLMHSVNQKIKEVTIFPENFKLMNIHPQIFNFH